MNKRITITGVNIVFLIFAAVFLFYQIAAAGILGADFFTENIYFVVLFNEFVVIAIPVIFYLIIKKANFIETLRIRKIKPLQAILVFFISIAAYPVAMMLNNIMVYFLQFVGDIPTQPIPIPQNLPELFIGILVIAVSPAICEEILHRGLLLSAYERRGSTKAIVVTAIFFGIFHFDLTNLLGPVFLGLLIGYYVIRTNSIIAGIIAHFTNNAIAEVTQYLFNRNIEMPDKITISSQELGQVMLLGLAGIILTALLLILFRWITQTTVSFVPPISRVSGDVRSILTHWPVIMVIILYIVLVILSIMSYVFLKYMG